MVGARDLARVLAQELAWGAVELGASGVNTRVTVWGGASVSQRDEADVVLLLVEHGRDSLRRLRWAYRLLLQRQATFAGLVVRAKLPRDGELS